MVWTSAASAGAVVCDQQAGAVGRDQQAGAVGRDQQEVVDHKAAPPKADAPQGDPPRDDTEKHKAKKKKKKDKGNDKDAGARADAGGVASNTGGDGDPDAQAKPESGGKTPKHPSIKIGHDVTLEFAARIEGDVRTATPDIGRDAAAAEWQDRRFGIEGTAFKRVTFEVSRELTEDFEGVHDLGEKTAWKDVYANYRVSKAFNIEGGRFKLPFGREELTGETNLDFVYRSLAARVLSPGRDVGLMTHGRFFKRRLEYQAGYFTRDGDNGRTTQTEGGEGAFAARVLVTPFAALSIPALAPFEIGIATENSAVDNRLGIRGRTVLGDGIFFDRVYVNGRRHRTGVEAGWADGPVSFATEYITVSDQRTGMGFDNADLPNVRAAAWYLAGTWALTGERKHGRIEPRRDLFRGGFGAIELAARVEKLHFDSIAYPGSQFGFPSDGTLNGNADRVTTFGVNWYLNHYLKIQANVVMESIDDPERSPAPTADGKFKSVIFRFQFRI
jgi:phosphate-selective porin OprO/OprP